jgi:hypothetical protein
MFFFEKKNQKNYVEPGGAQGSGWSLLLLVLLLKCRQAQHIFFGTFFQKRTLSLPL